MTDPLDMYMQETILYRLYDHTEQLLYIGITTHLPSRIGQHKRTKKWWPEVRDITIEHHATRQQAEQHERDAIKNENPKYNVTGKGGLRLPRRPWRIFQPGYQSQILNTPPPQTSRQLEAWHKFLDWYTDAVQRDYLNGIANTYEYETAQQLIRHKNIELSLAAINIAKITHD